MNAITPIAADKPTQPKRAVRLATEWTPDMIVTLTELWNDGLPTALIGKQFGLSASAVIGKAYRIDLPRRRKTGAQLLAEARVRIARPQRATQKRDRKHEGIGVKAAGILARVAAMPELKPVNSHVLASVVWTALPGAAPASLADLPANGCKWPIGDAPMLFCACERHGTTPYCETHARRAYAGFGNGIDGKAGPRHA